MTKRKPSFAKLYSIDDLAVECWCGASVVFIPRELVGKETASCGRPECKADGK